MFARVRRSVFAPMAVVAMCLGILGVSAMAQNATDPKPPAAAPAPAAQPATNPATTPNTAPPAAPDPANPAPQPVQPGVELPEGLTVESLTSKRDAADKSTELSDELKKPIVDQYGNAIANAEQIRKTAADAAALAERVKNAPQMIEQIKLQLTQTTPNNTPIAEQVAKAAEGLTVEQVEQKAREADAALAQAKSKLTEAESTLTSRRDKPKALRGIVEMNKTDLAKIDEQLKTPPKPDQNPMLTEATKANLLIRQRMLQQQIAAAEQELAGQDVLLSLRTQERDLATKTVKQLEETQKAWQDLAAARRQQEAAEQRKKAEEDRKRAMQLSPAIGELATDNVEYAKQGQDLTAKEARLKSELDSTKKALEDLKASKEKAEARVKAGLTEATGLLLRRERDELPNLREYRRKAGEREDAINDATEKQLKVEEERQKLADLDGVLKETVDKLDPSLSQPMKDWLKTEAKGYLETQRDLLDKLNEGYERYQKSLGDLEADQQELIKLSEAYAKFIDENVLWIRSMKPIGTENASNLGDGFGWLLSPKNWSEFGSDVWSLMNRRPFLWTLGLFISIGLFAARPWLKRRLRKIGELTGRASTDTFILTARALLVTAIIAAGLPLLMAFVGWRLSQFVDNEHWFSRSVGSGLIDAGIMLATLSVFFQVFTPGGLAESHFRWRKSVRGDLRKHLLWLIPIQVTTEFIVGMAETYASLDTGDDNVVRGTIGLIGFAVAMVTLSVFVALVLRSGGGVMSTIRSGTRDGWLVRLHFFWYWTAVGMPIVLLVLAGMGYFYTALQLDDRLQQTMWLVMGIIIVNAVIYRAYYVELRQLALTEAKRKAEAMKKEREEAQRKAAEQAEAEGKEAPASEAMPKIPEPEVDLKAIGEHTTALLRMLLVVALVVGTWLIWAEVLPALNVLDNFTLWNQSVTGPDGNPADIPITLTDLLTALLVLFVTVAASKNLPGTLEIVILSRLPIDAGARYAWATISQYTIVFVGLLIALSTLGFNMENLSVIVAALSVGLGFGLQEIVANFICGLILLFERPMRVGDIVEVGGVMGSVTRIRIRATTIMNFDRKEYIVPNKQFITGSMLNWTLSNTINRIVIPIGVAYGSDTEKTRAILKRICNDHPLICEDPVTLVTFEGFGDNALNFVVRTYLPNFDNRIEVIHQLHTQIHQELAKAGIPIAFPQRDIHLDTSSPLEIRVVEGALKGGEGS
ncbi:MAG: mechanosensitive ion channel [Phycisphaera sp.]|nr:mechanosensitive ion channel [Phycisphaera sp.]